MQEQFQLFLNMLVAVFVIVDPFAVIPVYMALTDRFTSEQRQAIRRKASIIGGSILIAFAVTGMGIFHVFGITLPAFQIAGGILLLLLGIHQLNADRTRMRDEEKSEGLEKEDVSIFPLATPLIAGPGAISTVVLFSSKGPAFGLNTGLLIGAIILVIIANHLILKFSHKLFRVLGTTGLNLLTRLTGIILCAVAVQFILNGLREALKTFS